MLFSKLSVHFFREVVACYFLLEATVVVAVVVVAVVVAAKVAAVVTAAEQLPLVDLAEQQQSSLHCMQGSQIDNKLIVHYANVSGAVIC